MGNVRFLLSEIEERHTEDDCNTGIICRFSTPPEIINDLGEGLSRVQDLVFLVGRGFERRARV